MNGLTREEYQELVLELGSKGSFGQFLGKSGPDLQTLWEENQLQLPVDYTRAQTNEYLLQLISREGCVAKAASHLGVSKAFLQAELRRRFPKESGPDNAAMLDALTKFKSIRMAARMVGATEEHLRTSLKEGGVDIKKFLDVTFQNMSAGKGRRAEQHYMDLRMEMVEQDMYMTVGPHAEYDVLDKEFGRVNVKSSREHRRSDGSKFWKISTRGASNADHLVAMCYDVKMQVLRGVCILKAQDVMFTGKKSIEVTAEKFVREL